VFDKSKFKALVHYICYERSKAPSTLGAVKLNKTLWLSDMAAYYELGDPITGARYVKREYGPVPHQILPALRELENEGVLTVSDDTFHGRRKKVYTVHIAPDENVFSSEELRIVDEMIKIVCEESTAALVSSRSHDDVWNVAEDGEEIPYFTVFCRRGSITPEEREWARMQLEQGN
jgi:hypothetical protein